MTLRRAFLVGYLPCVLAYLVISLAFFFNSGSVPIRPVLFLWFLLSAAALSVPALGIPFAWKTHRLFGLGFAVAAYLLPLLLVVDDPLPASQGLALAMALAFLVALACFVIAVPVSILPTLRANRSVANRSVSNGATASSEPGARDGSVEVAGERPLGRERYIDYGVGFFLGLLSSAAVVAFSYFLRWGSGVRLQARRRPHDAIASYNWAGRDPGKRSTPLLRSGLGPTPPTPVQPPSGLGG